MAGRKTDRKIRYAGRLATGFVLLTLAACQQQPDAPQDAQRVELGEARGGVGEVVLDSPDTEFAYWDVAENGHAVYFATDGEPVLLTLDCRLEEEPIQFAIIRHAPALPGQGALFAVMGNGHASRLPADAVLKDGEWRWEAVLPASDPQLDLFIGPGDMRATLPGRGAVAIPPSRIPGEFVEWCRAGGKTVNAPVVREEAGED